MEFKARLWAFVAGFGGAIAAILAFFSLSKKDKKIDVDIERIKSATEERIEQTKAQDLVNASVAADQHRATVGRIQSDLRDKAEEHLQNLLRGAGD